MAFKHTFLKVWEKSFVQCKTFLQYDNLVFVMYRMLHPVLSCTELLHPVFLNVWLVDPVCKEFHIRLVRNWTQFCFLKTKYSRETKFKRSLESITSFRKLFYIRYPFSAFLSCSKLRKSHKFLECKSEDPKSPSS